MAFKDLTLLLRDKGAAFFTFIFPLALAIFFGLVFGGGGNASALRVALVIEDQGPAAAALADDLKQATGLAVTIAPDRAAGETLVRKGHAEACVILPEGFQHQADNMLSGATLRIEGRVDPRRQAEAGLVTGKLNEVAFRQLASAFSDANAMRDRIARARASLDQATDIPPARKLLTGAFLATLSSMADAQANLAAANATPESPNAPATPPATQWQPIHVNVQTLQPEGHSPQNAFEVSFPQGVVWGLMGCVVAFGVSMATERAQGTLMRLAIAPISRHQLILGKALGCFLACLIIQLLLIALGTLIFGVNIRQPALMALAVVSSALGFTGVMMLMAGLTRTEGSASGMGRAVVLILAMIGGGTIPLAFMPPIMQKLSGISPFSWSTLAIEGAVWRGFTFTDMLWPCSILAAIGVVGFILGTLALRMD